MPRKANARSAGLLVFLLATGGCDGGPRTSAFEVRDTVVLQRLATIGSITGEEEYEFGHIAGVTGDRGGRTYVSDRLGSFIRVYDRGGEFLNQIGRKGTGPGEFSEPSDIFFSETEHLWVRDRLRATALASTTPGGIPDSVTEIRPFVGYTNYLSSARSRLIEGLYYYPGYTGVFRSDEPDRHFYFAYDENGLTGDTIHVPAYATLEGSGPAFYRTSTRGGRLFHGINRAPFEPSPTWELTADRAILGGSGRTTVVETDLRGDTLLRIELFSRRLVNPAERADSIAALQARLDSIPVPLDQLEGISERVRKKILPDTVPGFLGVHTAENGDIWVQRWPPEGDGHRTHFDVYTRGGEYVRSVVLPDLVLTSPPPYVGSGRMITVAQDPATDVHKVLVYSLDREQ